MRNIILKYLAIVLCSAAFSLNIAAQTDEQAKEQAAIPVKIKKIPTVRRAGKPFAGKVTLNVTLDKSAKVTKVEIVQSSGDQEFDNEAVKTAKKIEFKPAMKNGEPVTVNKTLTYSF